MSSSFARGTLWTLQQTCSPDFLVEEVTAIVDRERDLNVVLEQEKLQGLLRSLPEPLRTTAIGGHAVALYDLTTISPPADSQRQSSEKKKKQPSLLQRLRAVAPQLVAREPGRVTVLVDQGMALLAADGQTAIAAGTAEALIDAVRGCKAAGKASASMGMVLFPRDPCSREEVLRALHRQ